VTRLRSRLERLTEHRRRRHWPNRPLAKWTDAELRAALEEEAPGLAERIEAMTDAELDAALRAHGLL